MKFIRKNGKVIPINEKSGSTVGSKKNYPTIKRGGVKGAVIGASALGAIGAISGKKSAAIFAGIGSIIGGTAKYANAAKGESMNHLSMRMDRHLKSKNKSGV